MVIIDRWQIKKRKIYFMGLLNRVIMRGKIMESFNEKRINYNSICGIRRFFNLPCKSCDYYDKCNAHKKSITENKTSEKRVLLRKNYV